MGLVCDQIGRKLEDDGFLVLEDVLSLNLVDDLCTELEHVSLGRNVLNRGGTYGIRNLLETVDGVAQLASMAQIKSIAETAIGAESFAIRGLFFDKVPGANWIVPWHQDLTIATKEKREVDGYGPWSEKAGVAHVQPPAEILQDMVSIRIHLDDCDIENGPLVVVPGSHRNGKLSHAQVLEAAAEGNEVACTVGIGGAVVIKPLIVHSSSPARHPSHRRVVHLDFASRLLDGDLEWYHGPQG